MEGATTAGEDEVVVGKIREYGWRQGSVLPPSLATCVRIDSGAAIDMQSELAYVVTGDCNVVHDDLNEEPTIDVLLARTVAEPDGNFTNGKSPRRLHLVTQGGETALEFQAARHGVLLRNSLAEAKPGDGPALSEAGRLQLAHWWAVGRYLRSSFPDAFNERVKKANKGGRIDKLLKASRDSVLGIFVLVYPDREIASHEDYTVILRMVITDAADDDPKIRDSIDRKTYAPLIERLTTGTGITIPDHILLSESDFMYGDYRKLRRLEIEHLSYVGADGKKSGPVPDRG